MQGWGSALGTPMGLHELTAAGAEGCGAAAAACSHHQKPNHRVLPPTSKSCPKLGRSAVFYENDKVCQTERTDFHAVS